MNNEIKEILDNQKLINVENDYERIIFEYLANNCSEFDDEHIKQLVNLKVEQYKQSLDYITNLQKEVDKLTVESTEWEERTYCWQDRAEDLEIRIDKAIEYIEKNVCEENNGCGYYYWEIPDKNDLLNILKGEDK